MHGRDDRTGRPPAIRMARAATAAEARLIRSELKGLFDGTLRLRKAPAKKGGSARVDGTAAKSDRRTTRPDSAFTLRPAAPSFRAAQDPVPSAQRCERALAAAVAAFGNEDGRAFLDAHHRGLNGPPVEMAAASSAGLRVVEAAIAIEARRRAEGVVG